MQHSCFVGVDVSKAELTVAWADQFHPTRTVRNDNRALSAWLRTVPANACLGVESTGRYHQRLVELACTSGLCVYLLNPRELHHYAKAVHRGTKTDRLDAELIARFLAHEQHRLHPYQPPTALEHQLLRLQRRRAQLMRHAHALRQSLADLDSTLQPHIDELLRHFQRLVLAVDRRIQTLLRTDTERTDLAQRLRSVPGFGPLNAAHFATVLPTVKPRNRDVVVAYVGLDPRARDSGKFRGQRKLSKHGPSESRRLLYLAAMAAASHDPTWKTLYQRQRDRGRTTTEAFVILARRLLHIAFALYRHGGTYDSARVAHHAGLAT